ncbi:MAG: ATP-binding cassette domain-containing protein [Desulfovibrionales bacterium]
MQEPFIEFRNVTKRFGNKTVLDNVNLSMFKGEVTTIIGKSGVGKSVLIKHIIGLLQPDDGAVYYQGKRLRDMNGKERRQLKQKISYMFQHNALFDSMTIFQNIALPLKEKTDLSSSEIKKKVLDMTEALELSDPHKYPSQLSGGMQKRTALARALITNPEIVLFDEPTTGLDPIRKNAVMTMIARYQRRFGFTAVLVSHDIPDVFYISNRTALIEEGKILFQGSPIEIEQSQHPVVVQFTRSLIALKDDLTGLMTREEMENRFKSEMIKGAYGGEPFTAFMFTIENLGQVDSMAGNLSAQRVVQAIADFLRDRLEPMAWSGRYGVNQILSIIPKTDREKAEGFLEQLTEEMQNLKIFKTISHPGVCINFSVWVGMGQGRPGITDFRSVIASVWSDEKKLAQLQCGNSEQGL